MSKDACKDREE